MTLVKLRTKPLEYYHLRFEIEVVGLNAVSYFSKFILCVLFSISVLCLVVGHACYRNRKRLGNILLILMVYRGRIKGSLEFSKQLQDPFTPLCLLLIHPCGVCAKVSYIFLASSILFCIQLRVKAAS